MSDDDNYNNKIDQFIKRLEKLNAEIEESGRMMDQEYDRMIENHERISRKLDKIQSNHDNFFMMLKSAFPSLASLFFVALMTIVIFKAYQSYRNRNTQRSLKMQKIVDKKEEKEAEKERV